MCISCDERRKGNDNRIIGVEYTNDNMEDKKIRGKMNQQDSISVRACRVSSIS